MKPLTPNDAKQYAEIAWPGEPPFRRGIHPTMYRAKPWTMRQYAGFGSASDANQRFHYLLAQGQSALSVAFDLPTQLGLDSDQTQARGEVGRVGVAISSLDDMQQLMQGLNLDQVSTSMTINATAPILLGFYASLARQNGVGWEKLRGTVQNDILKEFIARGNYIYPPEPSLRLVGNLMAFCQKELPLWYPISVSGYHIREAGATALQELAFTFANAITYVKVAQAQGVPLQALLRRISFFFSVDNDFLEEVAKFRAARVIWAKILERQFKIPANDTAALTLRFHAQTGGSTLTAQQPKNNMVRVALQALAAVLGGAQSLHTNAYDEALALPTEASASLALRTQQIILEESGVADTVDPVGGAWAIEAKTSELVESTLQLVDEIEKLGGSARGVESGYFVKAIAQSAFEQQRQIETKKRQVVGVNCYESGEKSTPVALLKLDPQMEAKQISRLQEQKKSRASTAVNRALTTLRQNAADPKVNLLPDILACVESQATLGEISQVLLDCFGKFQPRVHL